MAKLLLTIILLGTLYWYVDTRLTERMYSYTPGEIKEIDARISSITLGKFEFKKKFIWQKEWTVIEYPRF